MHNCLICQNEFESESSLHKHLKAHKLLVAEYYQKYMPRYDKHDGSLILFKNKEQYLSQDFNSRENLKRWIQFADTGVATQYCKELLIKRKQKKNLVWSPTQVELRTTMMPPIQVYNELFGDYYSLCEQIGFKNKLGLGILEQRLIKNPYIIYIDSREQAPLCFQNIKTETKGLKVADYACSDTISCNCYIERKSVSDFRGTFSGGFERFCRELDRAKELDAYIVVLVERSLNDCLNFQDLPEIYHKNTKVTPEFVFHNVRELIQKYDNLQFLFVNGRTRAAEVIVKIFESSCSYKLIDLQFYHDTGYL